MIRKFITTDALYVQTIALACFDNNIRGEKRLYLARHCVKSYFKAKNIDYRLKHGYELYIIEAECIKGFIEIQNGEAVTNIFIDPPHQSHGHGTQLLDYALKRCLEINPDLDYVSLDAEKDAIKFYLHYGFVSMGRMKKVMGVEMTMMQIKLKNN